MQKPLLRNSRSKLFIIIMLSGLLSGCVKDSPFPHTAKDESADVVFDWYKLISRIQRNTTPAPGFINFRNFGFIGVGLYEAVQPGIKGAVSLSTKLYQMPGMPQPENDKHYLWGASANAALPSLMKQLLVGLTDADKASMDSLEEAYNDRFRNHLPDAVIRRSAEFGKAIANAIYQWSTTDNFNFSAVGYVPPPVIPSSWIPTPPGFAAPAGPFLANSRPFLAYSLTATAPPLPFPFSEDPTSEFYKAAKEVYDVVNALTPEQKLIPNWWADVGGPGVGLAAAHHILSITTWILEKKKAKLGQAVQTYAKTSIGLKDGPIIVWRSKFSFNLLRPITYINRLIDPTWASFLVTPPYPDYLSGLSGAIYSPAMQVLKREFGDIPITDNAYVWRGSGTREYASITELVKEASDSRVLAGIHYQFTQDISIEVGQKLGNQIADIRLVPSKH